MPETIKDGTGGSYEAKVNSENQLFTRSTNVSEISHVSKEHAESFGVSTPMLTVTTTLGKMLYIKNTSTTKGLYISDVWINWNGGSTNRDRCVEGQFIFGDGAPSGNNTANAAGVLNRSSSNTADMTVQYWDEVSTGMTMASSGTAAFYFTNTKGTSHYRVDGGIILGTNDTITLAAKGEEIGEYSVNILCYYE